MGPFNVFHGIRAESRAGGNGIACWVFPGVAGPCQLIASRGVFQAHKLLGPKRPHRSFFESFIRTLIIVCTALAVVLSSVSICDGHWLLVEDRLFGLWYFCTISNHSEPHCLRDLSQAQVPGVAVGMGLARSVAAMAVVAAIFGLELLIVSQVCEDVRSRSKWAIGSYLLLVAFILSSGGLLTFIILLKNQITLMGFTLMFWCEFTASFLFFLNATSGLHINSLTRSPPAGTLAYRKQGHDGTSLI